MEKYETVDEYLDNFSGETRKKLDMIRSLIQEEVPEAGEKISYGIPTIKINNRYVIYFAGFASHVSIYPLPKSGGETLQKEIEPYIAGKGTLRFKVSEPLPLELITKVVKAKLEDYKQRR